MPRKPKPTKALTLHTPAPLPSVFEGRPHLQDAVRDYVEASEAPNTARARKADWSIFTAWCAEHSVSPLPAEPATVAAFLADQSDPEAKTKPKAVATVARYAQSIHSMHRLKGFDSPTAHEAVKMVLRGIRRTRGTQQKQKEALTAERVAQAMAQNEDENPLRLLRDKVVILLGLATAMRRSELCALDIEDFHSVDGGFVISLRKSKTDQEGVGRSIAVARIDSEFCAVGAVEEWITKLGRTTGPLLCSLRKGGHIGTRLTPGVVSEIVKRFVEAGGFDPAKYGGHSLRAGFVTTARKQGVDWASIMEQTGHKRLETAKLYTRYTPDVFAATRIKDVFQGAFEVKGKKK